MLARPASSFIAEFLPWHMVFFISAAVLVVLAIVLARALPPRIPQAGLSYGALLSSMGWLVATTPILRRRSLYHAFMFAAFSLFWTTAPLLLSGPDFGLSQGQIALFALAGAAGAIAAPISGRLADKGWSYAATRLSMISVAAAFLVTHIAPVGSMWALGLLTFAAILLDFGVVTNLVMGQRAIFVLGAEYRSRLNGPLHGHLLCRWRYRFGARRLALCARRLVGRLDAGLGAAGLCTRLFAERTQDGLIRIRRAMPTARTGQHIPPSAGSV